MPPLRSPGRASAPCTLAKDQAFTSLKSKQPHHPPHHTPSQKPVIRFPILPTPHPSRTVSHPPSLATSIQLGKHCFPNLPPHKNAPLSAAVESDTVGYTTIEMQAGKWYQIGTPFVELDEGTVPTMNTVFTEGFGDGDLAYILGPNGTYMPTRQWMTYRGQTGWFNMGTGRYDGMELSVGQAVFFSKKQTGVVSLKGRVAMPDDIEFGNDSANSWSQVSRAYPNGRRSVNDLEWGGIEDGDLLYIYNPESGTYLPTRQWMTYNGETGWFNRATGKIDTQAFEPHQAFFINKKSAGKGHIKASHTTL